MGKGDRRSRRGKIWRGSYGNTRKRKDAKKAVALPSQGKAIKKPKKVKRAVALEDIAVAEIQQPEVVTEVTLAEEKGVIETTAPTPIEKPADEKPVKEKKAKPAVKKPVAKKPAAKKEK